MIPRTAQTPIWYGAGMDKKIQFGDRVRDSLSGHEGIVVSLSFWRNGCHFVGVMAPGKAGEEEKHRDCPMARIVVEEEKAHAIDDFAPQDSIVIGAKCKDNLTGIKGVVECLHYTAYNGLRVALQPTALSKEGARQDLVWLDEGDVVILEDPAPKPKDTARAPGGPVPAPTRPGDPRR